MSRRRRLALVTALVAAVLMAAGMGIALAQGKVSLNAPATLPADI